MITYTLFTLGPLTHLICSLDRVLWFSSCFTFPRCCFILLIINCLQMFVVSTFLSLDSFCLLLTLVAVLGVTAVGVKVLPDCKEIQCIFVSGKTLSFFFLSLLLSGLSSHPQCCNTEVVIALNFLLELL